MDLLIGYLLSFYGPAPYFVIFGILLACGLGLPIPEDITLFAAGLLSYYGVTELWIMIPLCFFGVILGDAIIFILGAKYGRKLTRRWFFHKLLPDDRLETVQKQFQNRGNKLLFAARFMPGLRAPVYFSAGVLHVKFRTFVFYDGSAALLSVPLIVGAVYYFGDQLDWIVRLIQKIEHGIIFVIIAILVYTLFKFWRSKAKARVPGQEL